MLVRRGTYSSLMRGRRGWGVFCRRAKGRERRRGGRLGFVLGEEWGEEEGGGPEVIWDVKKGGLYVGREATYNHHSTTREQGAKYRRLAPRSGSSIFYFFSEIK